jgi:AraC-like DNA-binding protein
MADAPLIFLYATHVPHCRHHIDKVFQGYSTLQYMEPGSPGGVKLEIGNRHFGLKGRWFWSCYPGPRICFHPAPNPKRTQDSGLRTGGGQASYWNHRYVAFRDSGAGLLARWAAEGLFPIAPQRAPGASFGKRVDALIRLVHRHDHWSQRRAVHALEGLLLELAEARATADDPEVRQRPWLPAVLQKLETAGRAGAATLVNYDALAADLGISVETFRRQFRAAVGVSPHAYVVQARIAAAKKLLAETRLPLKSVAASMGYNDLFFFARQFRQTAGVTPGMYRRSVQG